jgi:hypothetical protein
LAPLATINPQRIPIPVTDAVLSPEYRGLTLTKLLFCQKAPHPEYERGF